MCHLLYCDFNYVVRWVKGILKKEGKKKKYCTTHDDLT